MSTKTPNYKLEQPAYEDIVDVSVLNANFDIIDGKMKANADAAAAAATAAANAKTTADAAKTAADSNKYTLPSASETALGGIKLKLTATDPGKNSTLAANTICLVYEN